MLVSAPKPFIAHLQSEDTRLNSSERAPFLLAQDFPTQGWIDPQFNNTLVVAFNVMSGNGIRNNHVPIRHCTSATWTQDTCADWQVCARCWQTLSAHRMHWRPQPQKVFEDIPIYVGYLAQRCIPGYPLWLHLTPCFVYSVNFFVVSIRICSYEHAFLMIYLNMPRAELYPVMFVEILPFDSGLQIYWFGGSLNDSL